MASLQQVPGYGGFAALWDHRPLPMKTAVSSRMPLAARAAASQHHELPLLGTLASQATASTTSGHPLPAGSNASAGSAGYFALRRTTHPTTYMASTEAVCRVQTVVPERMHDRANIATSHMPLRGIPESKLAGHAMVASPEAAPAPPGFFSQIRKIEQEDDNARALRPARTARAALRSHEITYRRETDEQFVPPRENYKAVDRQKIMGLPALQQSLVTQHFSHDPPKPSSVIEYGAPGSNPRLLLSDDFTHTAVADPPHALLSIEASRDMFVASPKSLADVTPGYMGHVPGAPSNLRRMHHAGGDTLKEYVRTAAALGSTNERSKSFTPLRSAKRGEVELAKTTVGAAQMQVIAGGPEHSMNATVHGRKNAVRQFFSEGLSQQDATLADQFCSKFRPLEGCMRQGLKASQRWISDKDLFVRSVL